MILFTTLILHFSIPIIIIIYLNYCSGCAYCKVDENNKFVDLCSVTHCLKKEEKGVRKRNQESQLYSTSFFLFFQLSVLQSNLND